MVANLLESPEVEVAETDMPELSEPLEYIGEGDKVYIDPKYGITPFYAYVEAVFEDSGCVKVWHAQGGYPAGVWAVEDVQLVLKGAALAATAEAITTSA